MASMSEWISENENDSKLAREDLKVWPLDSYNTKLLNEVHPKGWSVESKSPVEYDLIAIGAGAGGLVSSRQTARRGGKSAMISAHLAGGDCLNVGCVPSKALIRCAKAIREVKKAAEFGVIFHNGGDENQNEKKVDVDFGKIMERMRKLRSEIAPIDGHKLGTQIGVDVYQGFGKFLDERTIEVVDSNDNPDAKTILKFKKAVIATGGKASIPTNIPGLEKAPYTTNETLFNLVKLPKHMVILGSGVVALEMAQSFTAFGSKVTVLVRSDKLFPRSFDEDVGPTIKSALEEEDGVKFLTNAKITSVETLSDGGNDENEELPVMRIKVNANNGDEIELESDCLLVAAGRTPNVSGMNLEKANVDYDPKKGILVDDYAVSMSNPNVLSVGDCTAGVPRLTHMSGEMAKVVVQNGLFGDSWKLSDLVVPQCMYTEPEYASVGSVDNNEEVDVYMASLEHNDRAILESDNKYGYAKIYCKKGTGQIVACTVIASRAGEIINEVTLAMKHNIPLEGIGRNIHCYPTTGEAVMQCGLQKVNAKWTVISMSR